MSDNNTPTPAPEPKAPPAPPSDDVKAIKAELEALKKEKESWNKDQLGLHDKARLDRESQDKKVKESKEIENALSFNLTSKDFLKVNESILPKEMSDIFAAADKETYDSAIHKANATKAAMIQSFFSLQANVDYLTESQKEVLADYLKLTKNGKEEKAKEVYGNLFEPALNTLKRVKKAEDLARVKLGYSAKNDDQYKNKLMEHSRKHYLGGK